MSRIVPPLGRRGAGVAALAVAGVLIVAGCSSTDAGSSSGGGSDSGAVSESYRDSAASAPQASGPQAASLAGSGGGSGAAAAGSADVAADSSRQLVRTASASLVVDDAADAASRVSVMVEGAGGRVEERSVQNGDDGPASATLLLRVPSDTLNQTIDGLGDVGEVRDVSVTTSDVTGQATDLDARIAALKTSTDRLTQLLAGAESTADVVAAESALTQRQAELDSLTSQRALLTGQVEMATLSLYVASRDAAPVAGPSDFLDGLLAGWNSLVAALGAALVVAGVLLPWLVTAVIIVAAVMALVRLGRRVRGRRATLVATPSGDDQGS